MKHDYTNRKKYYRRADEPGYCRPEQAEPPSYQDEVGQADKPRELSLGLKMRPSALIFMHPIS